MYRHPTGTALIEAKSIPEPNSGCLIWLGAMDSKGYGMVSLSKTKKQLAHRYSYEAAIGPIPPGLDLDHLCRVTLCVNPAHLEPVTNRENNRRALPYRKLKTACINGHNLTDGNVYIIAGHRRQCRKCNLIAVQKYKQRKAESKS